MKQFSKLKITMTTAALAGTLLLSGCQLIKPSGPSAQLNIQSAQFLNPNVNNQAAPVVLTIYQLKQPFQFKQATYQELATSSAKVLGTNLIDKNIIEVRPNENKAITQPLSPNTEYLGIVAAYRLVNQAHWKSVAKVVNKKGNTTIVNIDLESQALTSNVSHQKEGFFAKLSV